MSQRRTLVEAAVELRRTAGVRPGDKPFDDAERLCPVCGRPLRHCNRAGVCRECQRAHLSELQCACGCGAHLDSRFPGRPITKDPRCLQRLADLAQLARLIAPAGRLTATATNPAARPQGRDTGNR
jgi:hypothetical protein